jgi:hypothetical protein
VSRWLSSKPGIRVEKALRLVERRRAVFVDIDVVIQVHLDAARITTGLSRSR